MTRPTAMTVSAIGLIVLLASVLADYIGVGAGEVDFGHKQIIGTIVGALILVAGLVLTSRAKPPT